MESQELKFSSVWHIHYRGEEHRKNILSYYHYNKPLDDFLKEDDVRKVGDIFTKDYGKGEKNYTFLLIRFSKSQSNDIVYVVAREEFIEEELKELEKYCPCSKCLIYKKSWYKFYLLMIVYCICGGICGSPLCGICNGCIYSGKYFTNQINVEKARECKNKTKEFFL